MKRVPPHELVDVELRLVVESLDLRRVRRLDLLVPRLLQGPHGLLATPANRLQILAAPALRKFLQGAVHDVGLAAEQQRLEPDLPVAVQQALLFSHRAFGPDLLAVPPRPQLAKLGRQRRLGAHASRPLPDGAPMTRLYASPVGRGWRQIGSR